jgi:co-chaperonin GroES (HSP10)
VIAVAAEVFPDPQYQEIEGVDLSTLKPLPHHLLVRWPGKKETPGGVLLPQNRERLGLMKGQVLLVGPECDPRIKPGDSIQFSMALCEKEFLGSQTPKDRDPVFFMREEAVLGITSADGDRHVNIEPVNGCVLVKPDRKPEEMGGIAVVDRDAKDTFFCWGQVVMLDPQWAHDFRVGDVIGYTRNHAEELKLSDVADADATVMHVLMPKMGSEIQAVWGDGNV